MKPGRPGFLSDRSGATATEFALVAVPFLLILFGLIEFGRAYWIRQSLYETAIAAARCLGVPQSECSASAGVRDVGKAKTYAVTVANGWGLGLTTANVTATASTSCGGVAGFSKVSVTYYFETVAPGIVSMLGGADFSAEACFPASS